MKGCASKSHASKRTSNNHRTKMCKENENFSFMTEKQPDGVGVSKSTGNAQVIAAKGTITDLHRLLWPSERIVKTSVKVGAIKFQSKKCLEEITEAYKYFPPALIRITKNIGDDHQYRGSKGKRRGAERHISMEKNREQESGALFEKVYVDIIFHSRAKNQCYLSWLVHMLHLSRI